MGTKPMVIVLEDDPSMLRALRRLIASAGFDVRTFDRPRALLDSGLPGDASCIVADVHLPEMNGVEVCRLLARRGRALPIILITAYPDESTKQLVSSVNPIAFLVKPFSRESLIAAITKALEA